ncbi:MAG: YfhO family protein [Oscillospiraceae bacterium]|nr:YfhO family protein [Oscillospiraceae bacterium]
MDTLKQSDRRSLPRRICSLAGVPLLSCGITLALFAVMNALYGIFPCGTNSIVWCDMEQQAVPLLVQLKELVQSGESVWFSPLDAGGMHFYAVFCFFLCNPFSLLVLVTDISADQLVTLIVFLKLALAAATASLWFRSRIQGCSAATAVLLGVMYGCSGYGLFYYQNLMWLDVMLLLPLLMYSLRRLLKRADPLPFLPVLTAILLTCFYIGYMIVIFIVLYMAVSVRTTVPETRRGAISLRFLLASLSAGGIASVVWLPCLIQVMQSARGVSIPDVLMQSELFQHLGDKICLLGCTCIGFSALILLWQKESPRISSRRRDRRIFLLLLTAAVLDPVNIMWHGGSYQAFPLRWGMIPILLMLTLAGKQLSVQFDENKAAGFPKAAALVMLGTGFAAVLACELILHFKQKEHIYSYVTTLWVSDAAAMRMLILMFLLTTVYAFAILFRQHRVLSPRVCTGFLAVLFLSEFVFQYDCYIGHAANDDALYAQTVHAAHAVQPEDTTARIRLTKKYAHANMVGALGIPTLAHYTSLTREDFIQGVKRFGYSSYWMEVPSTGGTVLSDAFWNVQYQLGVQADFPSWTDLCWTNGELSVSQSRLRIPPAHYTECTPEEIASLPEGSRVAVQKMLLQQLGGDPECITEYEPTALHNLSLTKNSSGETVCTLDDPDTEGEIRYSLFIPEKQILYFDLYSRTGTELGNDRNDAVSIRCNGRTVCGNYPENNCNGIQMLGEPEKEYVVVSIRVKHDFTCESFGVFGIAAEPLAEVLRNAAGTALHYQSGVYTADFQTDHPQTLVLAAAYDEGFTADIDGMPVPVYRVNDCQLAVKLPAGSGTVTLRYHTPGLSTACILCGVSLMAALLLFLLRKHIPKRLSALSGRGAALLLQAGFVLVLFAVYLLPLVFCIYGALTP